MSPWFRNAPKSRTERALVAVDLLNVVAGSGKPLYEGDRRLVDDLRDIGAFADSLALHPVVRCYLSTNTHLTGRGESVEIMLAQCRRYGYQVVHVGNATGRNDVDAAMIEDLTAMHEMMASDIPFGLVTADKGFRDVVASIRPNRAIYVAVPSQLNFPTMIFSGTGSTWLDGQMPRHHALYQLLSATDDRFDDEATAARRRDSDFYGVYQRLLLNFLLAVGESAPTWTSQEDLASWLEAHADALQVSFRPEASRYVAGALIHYHVVVGRKDAGLRINRGHRLFQPVATPDEAEASP